MTHILNIFTLDKYFIYIYSKQKIFLRIQKNIWFIMVKNKYIFNLKNLLECLQIFLKIKYFVFELFLLFLFGNYTRYS